uniref:Cytochrome c biogenesis protein CcsA n=1 Tax=Golenkinia longispicula TaxID=204992 RepID=A0A0S2ICX7_9CHLO|nr:heme attachment to plastid cytochrome c [Golenkinia longispicula]
MIDLNLENFLANFSFLFLFLSLIFYWIQTGIMNGVNSNFGKIGIFLSNITLFSFLVLRWKESGHFPLSNLYESLMFLSWSITVIHLLLENISDNKYIGAITAPCALFTNAFATFSLPSGIREATPLVPALQSNWLMMHVTVMILSYAALISGSLLSIAFLIITRGKNVDLQGNSLGILEREEKTQSVEQFFLRMADVGQFNFFLILKGKLRTFLFDLSNKFDKRNIIIKKISSFFLNFFLKKEVFVSEKNSLSVLESTNRNLDTSLSFSNSPSNLESGMLESIKLARTLDNLSYRVLGIGFPFLTIGILSGAVWANEAWGSYWSWDPKETWALLTWMVFAIYLHTRLTRGWQGKKPAILATVGFVTVWVCYLGVNLLGEGLHSYGWIHQS